MGACGSKEPPLVVEEVRAPTIQKKEEEENIVESNIIEPEDDDDLAPTDADDDKKEDQAEDKAKEQEQDIVEEAKAPKKVFDPDEKESPIPWPNVASIVEKLSNPIGNSFPGESIAIGDKRSPTKSSSTPLEVGLSKLEVPIQSPRNTKKVTVQDFFNDEVQSMVFDIFDTPSMNGCQESVGASDEIVDLKHGASKVPGPGNNKLPRKRSSVLNTSTSSYEEIIIESDEDYLDDEYEVESILMETRSNASYVEEVIEDEVYDAFVRAKEESHGALTFGDFIHHQQSDETSSTNVILVQVPVEGVLDERKDARASTPSPVPKTTKDLSVVTIAQEPSCNNESKHDEEINMMPVMMDLSKTPTLLEVPQPPDPHSIKDNGNFLEIELHLAKTQVQIPDIDPNGFLVSPLPSPAHLQLDIAAANQLISPLTVKGFDDDDDLIKETRKRSRKDDSKKRSSRSNKKILDENDKKSERKSSRKRKSTDRKDDTGGDDKKQPRKHHRRKEETKSSLNDRELEAKDKTTKSVTPDKDKRRSKSVGDEKRSSRSSSRRSSDKKPPSKKRQDDVGRKGSASTGSTESTKSNPIVSAKSSGARRPASTGNLTNPIRRSSRKIKFQPRSRLQEMDNDDVMTDHKSVESDRSDFVKRMDALRARLDEAVESSSELPTEANGDIKKRDDRPRSKHRPKRRTDQSSAESTVRNGDVLGDTKKKDKHKSSSSRTTSSSKSGKSVRRTKD